MAGVVKDIVHGYIDVEDDDFEGIIDTPNFQRLKRIRHLSAMSLFPSTNHTRYEHSLGTMHVATRIFDVVSGKLEQAGVKGFDYGEIDTLRATTKYAALLHDVSHSPFSHVLENPLRKNPSGNVDLAREVGRVQEGVALSEIGLDHEAASANLSLNVYRDFLLSKGVDLDLFVRMICGFPYTGPQARRNWVIAILNSDFDADRIDYLARDGHMTGTLSVDTDRIIQCFKLVPKDGEHFLVLDRRALSIISSFIHGREYLYYWVYNHRKVRYYDRLIQVMLDYLVDKKGAPTISVETVQTELVDDFAVESAFREYYYVHYLGCGDRRLCPTCSLAEQYFSRKHLTPVWRSPWAYNKMLEAVVRPDDAIKKRRLARAEEALRGVLRVLADSQFCDPVYDRNLVKLLEILGKPVEIDSREFEFLKTRVLVSQMTFAPYASRELPTDPKESLVQTFLEIEDSIRFPQEILSESVYNKESLQRVETSGGKYQIPYLFISPADIFPTGAEDGACRAAVDRLVGYLERSIDSPGRVFPGDAD